LDLEHRKLDIRVYSSQLEVMKEGLSIIKQFISYKEEKERTKQSEIEAFATIKKSELALESQIKQLEGIKVTESNISKQIELLSDISKPMLKIMNDIMQILPSKTIIEDEKLFDKFIKMQKELTNLSTGIGRIVR